MKLIYHSLLRICFVILLSGCSKGYLDKKPSTNIVVPETLSDFTNLLSNQIMFQSPALPFLSADEYYYASYSDWLGTKTATERNAYIWAVDLFNGENPIDDWNTSYQQIFYANVVLEGLSNIQKSPTNIGQWNYIKGWALYSRAFALYNLVNEFSPIYDSVTASIDLGVPVRLSADVSLIVSRSTVQETFDQIFSDLQEAIPLLSPEIQSNNLNLPSKISDWALLSRIYLSIRQYAKAELYADSSLSSYNILMDYNTLSQSSNSPIGTINPETIFFCTSTYQYYATEVGSFAISLIDTALYNSYDSNDLRKTIYFRLNSGSALMKLGYTGDDGGVYPFTGIAVDELDLIKAECLARRGDSIDALSALNALLITRWASGTFTPYVSDSSKTTLQVILTERKKELVWRGLRWSDIRRLNKEGWNIVLTRILNNQIYTLTANDPRYVFPIPDYEVSLSGIKQNVR